MLGAPSSASRRERGRLHVHSRQIRAARDALDALLRPRVRVRDHTGERFIARRTDVYAAVRATGILAVRVGVGPYALIGNTAASDEGAMRVVLLAAMGPLLVVSLAGSRVAFRLRRLIFVVAYLGVRVLYLVGYAVSAQRPRPALLS